MSRNHAIPCAFAVWLLAWLNPGSAFTQVIDFETLPGGTPTVDLQEISNEYSVYGVTFTLLDRVTGLPMGFPRIVKAGDPATAFSGCYYADTPLPHHDLGESFLSDGTQVEIEADLLIEFTTPVAQVSGIIIDLDCRNNGTGPCEQVTVTAFDAADAALDSAVVDAPAGPSNPDCLYSTGPGDGEAFGWFISTGTAQISSIVLRYTSTASDAGIAFDNITIGSAPAYPTATVSSPTTVACRNELIELAVAVSGGLPPYFLQWEQEYSPGTWRNLGNGSTQTVQPLATTRYRVKVTDTLAHTTATAPVQITVQESDPLCQVGMLVSSYGNDRLIRYSLRSGVPQVLVPAGSGGLNGPSKLICADDGYVYVSSQVNNRVLRYDGASGEFVDTFVAANSGGLSIPAGLDFGPDGNLYVVSYSTHEVLSYAAGDGSFMDAFVPNGSGLNGPSGLIFGPDDNLYVCSFNGDKVLRFDGTTGAPLGDFVTAGSGGLDAPRGLAFGPDGNLYVAEQYNDSVRRFNGVTGAFIDVFVTAGSGGLDRANDVAFGPDGFLYVTSFNNNKVLRYDDETGDFLGELANDFLNGPGWLAIGCGPFLISDVPQFPRQTLDVAVEPGVPNPFNPRTTVAFTLARPGHARVMVVDIAGRLVATLMNERLAAGNHNVAWDGRSDEGRAAPSGVYFLTVQSGQASGSAKMMLIR